MAEEAKAPSEEEIQSTVGRLIQSAASYVDTDLSPLRTRMTDFYLRKKFGNESEGRSQIVMSDVADTVDAIVPGMMKVFWGPERVVAFEPEVPVGADAAMTVRAMEYAQQASEYINQIFGEENAGFMETLAVIKDGLVRRLGVFKYGWEEQPPQIRAYEGLTEEQVTDLLAQHGKDVVRAAKQNEDGTYWVRCLFPQKGRLRVWALPPEDFIFNREARTIDDALIVAHRTQKTTSELRALGISRADIEEHGGIEAVDSAEKLSRAAGLGHSSGADTHEEGDKSTHKHTYIEAYVKLDLEGEGFASRYLVRAIGPGFHVVGEPEPVIEPPFALWCPKPEPHTIDGLSIADVTMDLQLLSSSLFRGMLDSLALSIFPRTAYVEGQVSVADMLNTEIGAPIRQTQPGMVQPISHDFSGREVLPVLGYVDEMKERRTGQSKGAQGLDADALQSSTQSAVAAAVTSTQQQLELYARVFAEQCLKPLFRGLLRVAVENADGPVMLKRPAGYTQIDPSTWSASMCVSVNVALGVGFTEQKIQAMTGIAAKQEQILGMLGPENPLCGLPEYRNTLATLVELAGRKDVARFFKEIPPGWTPPQQPQQMTPEQTMAQATLQAEQMKTEREFTIKQAELQLRKEAQDALHEREEMQISLDANLRRYEIELKYHGTITQHQLAADTKATEALLDAHSNAAQLAQQADQAAQQQASAAQDQAHGQMMDQRAQDHTETIDHRQQDHAENQSAQQQELAENQQAHQQQMDAQEPQQ